MPSANLAISVLDRFQLLLDAVDDYAIFMLEPDGTVASWNSGAERIKGYTADEIVGRPFTVFYRAEDVAAGIPERELALATACGHHREEGWRVRKDGTTFWANVVITAIRDRDGALTGFAKVTHDDTDRQRLELLGRHVEVMNERERISLDLQETVVRQVIRAALRLSTVEAMTTDILISRRVAEVIDDLDATLREIRGVITDLHLVDVRGDAYAG